MNENFITKLVPSNSASLSANCAIKTLRQMGRIAQDNTSATERKMNANRAQNLQQSAKFELLLSCAIVPICRIKTKPLKPVSSPLLPDYTHGQ